MTERQARKISLSGYSGLVIKWWDKENRRSAWGAGGGQARSGGSRLPRLYPFSSLRTSVAA